MSASLIFRLLRSSCLGFLLLVASPSFAQVDQEPNSSCFTPQSVGSLQGPLLVSGTIDPGDVDFFMLSAAPGARLTVDLQGDPGAFEPLRDPFLGFFDVDCQLQAANDDFFGLNSRLEIVVPASGVLILAATSFPDGSFVGAGSSTGAYQLIVTPPPASIGSIAGRLVDAVSRAPLSGIAAPFASVELLRCDASACTLSVAQQPTDASGRFRFEVDPGGARLPVGTYLIRSTANEFRSADTARLVVGENQNLDVGDIALVPPAIRFSDIVPCGAILPQGSTCRYSVRIQNNTTGPLRGIAWSIVDGMALGSQLGFTTFEASTATGVETARRAVVNTRALSSSVLTFQFDVPSFAPNGASFCTRVFFGLNPSPLVNSAREGLLFCMSKGDTGFRLMEPSDSQTMLQSLSSPARSVTPK